MTDLVAKLEVTKCMTKSGRQTPEELLSQSEVQLQKSCGCDFQNNALSQSSSALFPSLYGYPAFCYSKVPELSMVPVISPL